MRLGAARERSSLLRVQCRSRATLLVCDAVRVQQARATATPSSGVFSAGVLFLVGSGVCAVFGATYAQFQLEKVFDHLHLVSA
jgi:hypothetical protein